MQGEVLSFLENAVAAATKNPQTVSISAWGRTRTFVRYDLFDDTFILEEGILEKLENRDPVILVAKSALRGSEGENETRVFGNIMAVTSGNHAVSAIPLLSGELWGLSTLQEESQAQTLSAKVVCANLVGDTIEISQRDVATADVAEMDEWLQELGLPMRRIVLADRVDATLEFYSRRGQEWRIKPLAWTQEEMAAALRSSISRIHSPLHYYHNVKGVHFLSYQNFHEWGRLIGSDLEKFLAGLRELAATGPGQPVPNLLLPKVQSHHEIEFFGIPPGAAERSLIPPTIEMWHRAQSATDHDPTRLAADLQERFEALDGTFRSLLADPAYADDSSPKFLETIYRHITGAIYQDEHDTMSRAFDDLRTALPGATYTLGNRFPHDGADARTLAILDSIETDIGHGDRIEYVNIYEIRSLTDKVRLGEGKTREIVYKTAWNPLPRRLVEKRLARRSTGYGAYTLMRIHAFRALGVSYGPHRLLARNDGAEGDVHYFTRERYPGQPFSQLPQSSFYDRDPRTGVYETKNESADIVRATIVLVGGAAAENLILKKCTPDGSTRFAQGKEIVEFGYDIHYGKQMPLRIRLCSVRGTMGWPCLDKTNENFERCCRHFLKRHAEVAHEYALKHDSVDKLDIADAFWEGFAARTRQIYWNYQNRREQFDSYNPRMFGDYKFAEKWSFALWALEMQRQKIDVLAEMFHAAFRALDGGGNDDCSRLPGF
jgi:hypothetical protein